MIQGTSRAFRQARTLRRDMTLPEVLLWQRLRRSGTGHKWRRQHAAGHYVLDFYCVRSALCVEIDGEAHSRGNQPTRDIDRDAWLARQGIETLRVPAVDVLTQLDEVVLAIAALATQREPLHHPAALDGPPPRASLGEDW